MKKMRTHIFAIAFILLHVVGYAQNNTEATKQQTLGMGYFCHIQPGLLAGEEGVHKAVFTSLHIVNGYQINDHFSLGMGVGADFLEFTVFPVFADARLYGTTNQRAKPFVGIKGGYAFAKSSKPLNAPAYGTFDNRGGVMVNPEIGVLVRSSDFFNFTISFGYRFQQTKSTIKTPAHWGSPHTTTYYHNVNYNRFSVTIGFVFR